jgi:hypothetical protein
LRDHEVFRKPRPLDLQATLVEPTPQDWVPYLPATAKEQITWLPLVPGGRREWPAGWCTYAEHIGDSPDVEILCGGMNSKLPSAAAVWRQGNLLHFGFEQSPAEMNGNGRALLENCIVYASRFRDDRPLARTPSPFVVADYPKPLRYLLHAVRQADAKPADLAGHFTDPVRTRLSTMPLAEVRDWVSAHADFLCAGAAGKLAVDEDALALRAPLGKPEFFDAVLAALDDEARAAQAVRLLARRMPDGPGGGGDAAAWRAFVTGHRPFLFFLQEGGYLWHLDPLAKARGVPCAELRGPARATDG